MCDPLWIRALCRRHGTLVTASCRRALTAAEALEHARIQSLLEAYEMWDCNGTEALLRARLVLQALHNVGTQLAAALRWAGLEGTRDASRDG
jgi:hypothetical protein